MEWHELYPKDNMPDEKAMADYIASPLWEELNSWLSAAYKTQERIEYSTCGGAPGWNRKHRKGGKALCTLYPRKGYYICLVCVGQKQENEAELIAPTFCPYMRELFERTEPFCGTRWLMAEVRNEATLADVKKLVDLRVKFK